MMITNRLTNPSAGEELIEFNNGEIRLAIFHSQQRAYVQVGATPKAPVQQRVLMAIPQRQFVAA